MFLILYFEICITSESWEENDKYKRWEKILFV